MPFSLRSTLPILLTASLAAQTHWPPPPTPAGNPTTPSKVLLGKALFWDEQLSSTGTSACGSCHIPAHGGADPRALSAVNPGPDGVHGTADDRHASPGVPANLGNGVYDWVQGFGSGLQVTPRTAPSMINAAYLTSLFWDGRVDDGVFRDPLTNQVVLGGGAELENLIAQPPLNDVEMGHPGRTWADVVTRVQTVAPLALASNLGAPLQAFVAGQGYAQLFQQVYGSPGVDAPRIVMAIAAYLRTLVSDRSPYDDFLAGTGTLPAPAMQGLTLFTVFCSRCHTNLDNGVLAGGPRLIEFRNSGVRTIAEDRGRGAITAQAADDGKFKVPDLRNVALRGPFFHNGGQPTLADVLLFYNRGGDFHVNQDVFVQIIQNQLSATDRADLLALLNTFTDPRVQNEIAPFDRPTLFPAGANHNLTFGTGTPGTGGLAPRAIAVAAPRLGAMVTVAVDGAQPNGAALLGWDLAGSPQPTTYAGLDVHLALTPAASLAFAGYLLGGNGPGSGHLSRAFALPANPAFAGVTLYGQWLVADPAGPSGFAATGGFRLLTF
ncbi:MAG: cytochrome c peroxidase [Planctomycetota bacterium]